MGENLSHDTVSTVSHVSDHGDRAGLKTILRPDWNRRFNRADDADGGDAKSPTTTQERAFRRPDGVWVRLPASLGARRTLPSLMPRR